MSSVKVCIIIIAYNPQKWIRECLFSISRSSVVSDILIIDNNSSDNYEVIISNEFKHLGIKLIKLKNNIGFGQANNIGLSYALQNNYDFVFLLNQDAWIEIDTVEELISVSLKNKDFAILSPIHLNGEGNRIDLNFSIYINEIRCKGFISDFILGKHKNEVYELPFVNAAAWLIPIVTLKKIGGFDPVFFHYGEDDNYCQRVLFHGLKIGVVPKSFIHHDRGQEFTYPYLFHDLRTFDRVVKPKISDINKDFVVEFKNQKRELDSFIFFSIIDFKIRRVLKLLKFRSHLIKMKPELKKSIEINKNTGPNYLNESFDIHSNS